MMKRLLLVSSNNPRDKRAWSGTKYSIYCQLKQYYDVTILTLAPVVWARRIDKYCMLAMTMGKQHTPFGLMDSYCKSKKVERELRNGKYDVVFVLESTSIPFLRTKTPVVYITDATTHLMQHYYWDYRWPLDWVADVIQKKCMEKSDVVLASSTWAINDMTSFFSIPPNKCKLCIFGANGVVEDRETVCNKEAINLVFVGVDWKRKGGDVALDALRILRETDTIHQIVSDPELRLQLSNGGKKLYAEHLN